MKKAKTRIIWGIIIVIIAVILIARIVKKEEPVEMCIRDSGWAGE